MECCLETVPSFVSVVVGDSTAQGVTPGSPEAWEGRNSVNIAPMEQMRSPLVSTQRVDANGVVAQYIWSRDHEDMVVLKPQGP